MNYVAGIKLREKPDEYSYLSELKVIQFLSTVERISFNKPVTFFVGENGTGKSTLLESIAVLMGFNAEGGSRDFSFSTNDTHSELCEYMSVIKRKTPKDGFFLRAESFYNTATYLEKNSNMLRYGGVSFHEQSHGESFLALVENRFTGNGLYILDEPEAALSPQRLMSLIVAIDELTKADSQLIIATHSPILMAYPNSEILELSDKGIQRKNLKDTEHFIITKQFINNPERMIRYLLGT